MIRTPTLPPTDKAMWRKLLARTHPDTGGDHELFIWAEALREHVADDAVEEPEHPRPRRTTNASSERVPFEHDVCFDELNRRARRLARSVPQLYSRLLGLAADCEESFFGPLAREQRRGASYKRLAAAGHAVGMSKPERVQWYKIAESVPLSDRHVGHLLTRLKDRS